MKYFLDCEFIENGVTIDLISIGIVGEDNREYYAINSDCNLSKASDWVKDNVITQLPPQASFGQFSSNNPWKNKARISTEVAHFMGAIDTEPRSPHFAYAIPNGSPKPEIWTYYGAYDHVVICQLFGTMMDLPKGFPMYTMDLKQWCKQLGDPQLPRQSSGKHNALDDAKHNKLMWEFLDEYSRLGISRSNNI